MVNHVPQCIERERESHISDTSQRIYIYIDERVRLQKKSLDILYRVLEKERKEEEVVCLNEK